VESFVDFGISNMNPSFSGNSTTVSVHSFNLVIFIFDMDRVIQDFKLPLLILFVILSSHKLLGDRRLKPFVTVLLEVRSNQRIQFCGGQVGTIVFGVKKFS